MPPLYTSRLPAYRTSHTSRYHPYRYTTRRQDEDHAMITVDHRGSLEPAFGPEQGCEHNTPCDCEDPDASPYQLDLPIVGDEVFFGNVQEADRQATCATTKVAAAFVNMMFKLRRRYLALLAVADFLRHRQA